MDDTDRSLPEPGPHGGDVLAVASHLGVDPDDICDLSANLNPDAPDVVTVVRAAAPAIGRYPDPGRATATLAAAIGVEADRVVLTNGGAEAIALVASLMPRGWVERPEFSLYERHLATVERGAPRWRSNPSSPLGVLAGPDERAAVWDEAYWQLATGTWTRGDDDAWRVGSLTKLWACPGLRVGYVVAPDGTDADAVRARQPRWAASSLACAAVERLVPDADLAGWSASIARRRRDLIALLEGHGLEVRDTATCWVLVRRHGLRDALLRRGVLVRDCASFGLTDWHRIAVPDDRGAEQLVRALDAAMTTFP